MKPKRTALLLSGLLAVLTGCSLAQPEKGDVRANRFLGFYVAYDKDETVRNEFWSSGTLTEIGTMPVDTQWGRIDVPQTGVIAENRNGEYTFPGLEGYSLFVVKETSSNGSPVVSCASNMADTQMHYTETDSGSEYAISGTIYIGPPIDAGTDWDALDNRSILTLYRVYETPDGFIYLDGSGNSIVGGLGTYSEKQTHTLSSRNGTSTSETVEVTVEALSVPRLAQLVVSQFDENSMLLRADDLAIREDLPKVDCLEETAWVLVEERSAEGTVRTVYSAPGAETEPVSTHNVILLDDDGRGHTAELTIRFG